MPADFFDFMAGNANIFQHVIVEGLQDRDPFPEFAFANDARPAFAED